jgi:hypothetical protein
VNDGSEGDENTIDEKMVYNFKVDKVTVGESVVAQFLTEEQLNEQIPNSQTNLSLKLQTKIWRPWPL